MSCAWADPSANAPGPTMSTSPGGCPWTRSRTSAWCLPKPSSPSARRSCASEPSGSGWNSQRRPSAGELGQRRALVRRDVVGLVALDLVLGLVLARAATVALVLEVLRVDLRDRAPHPACLGVPADVIADLEPLAHDASPSVSG